MKQQGNTGLTRRALLKGSLGVTLGAGCFTFRELRNALAQAGGTGKPLLLEPELNARIPMPLNRQAYLAHINHAKLDLLGYLNTNFQLTPRQIAEVQSIPKEDLLRLNALLDHAAANNLRITVRFMPAISAPPPGPNTVYLRSSSITTRGTTQFFDKITGASAERVTD